MKAHSILSSLVMFALAWSAGCGGDTRPIAPVLTKKAPPSPNRTITEPDKSTAPIVPDSDYEVSVLLKNVVGISTGARINFDGAPIGYIADLRLDGQLARATLTIHEGVVLWDNAVFYTSPGSLLGAIDLDIFLGTPESINSQGTTVRHKQLEAGSQILYVIEDEECQHALSMSGVITQYQCPWFTVP